MSRGQIDPIVLNYDDHCLRLSDIQILQGPHWLNDHIVSFYYRYLGQLRFKSNPDIVFVTPSLVHCMDLMEEYELERVVREQKLKNKDFVLFPVCDSQATQSTGIEWSLVVLSRPDKTFYYFDSFGNKKYSAAKVFIQHVKDAFNCRQYNLKVIQSLQLQSNNYDCGVLMLCLTDIIADYANRFDCVSGFGPVHLDTMSAKRSEMLKLIKRLGGKI